MFYAEKGFAPRGAGIICETWRGRCPTLSAAGCELQTGRLRLATPSPGPPRLKKTPTAVHPLPQGGDGRKLHKAKKAQHKCRNGRAW